MAWYIYLVCRICRRSSVRIIDVCDRTDLPSKTHMVGCSICRTYHEVIFDIPKIHEFGLIRIEIGYHTMIYIAGNI
jgi:hypothetical protein